MYIHTPHKFTSDFWFIYRYLYQLPFTHSNTRHMLLITSFGHSPPQDCKDSRFSGFLIQSSHCTCCTLIWQWHLMRSICLQGGQGPGWHFMVGQLWVQPSGRGFWQPASHSSQLSPCCKQKESFIVNVYLYCS